MTYDNPYRYATLVECSDAGDGIYHAISANEDDDRVMSSAAYDIIKRTVEKWFEQPDVLSCKLNVEDGSLGVFIDTIGDDREVLAEFTVPFAELVLSAAHTCQEWDGTPPSDVSAMLRKLADQIDGKEAA